MNECTSASPTPFPFWYVGHDVGSDKLKQLDCCAFDADWLEEKVDALSGAVLPPKCDEAEFGAGV